MGEEDLRQRGLFIGLTPTDASNLEKIRALLESQTTGLIDQFHEHLAKFSELRRFLGDPQTLTHLKEAQQRYLLTLGKGWETLAYCEDRLQIGYHHERISLQLKWYLGAYGKLFELLSGTIVRHYEQQPQEIPGLLVTLSKIFLLDQELGIEAYYGILTERMDGLLVELADAQHRGKEASRWDVLTHVLNRKHLIEALEMEFHRSQRFKHPFSVLFMDIDHFKQLNDQHGHVFGDLVLETLGRKLRALVRPEDIVGRYGGEEFVIGLVECPADTAALIAERLRASISMTKITHNRHVMHATVSVGIASSNCEASSLEELLKKADAALYQAKELGRNRVAFIA